MKHLNIGTRLKSARRRSYPNDTLTDFALRIGISRATYQKMEQGDLSVTLGKYYSAAEILDLTNTFDELFIQPASLFDD